MAGGAPPYIYQKASKYEFNDQTGKGYQPKGVTQASWAPRASPPKRDGPLIDAHEFNKHPDSYMIVPYGNLDWKPMSKNTKKKVQWIRGGQLFLRLCELLGALGLLFCVICIRPIGTSLDWIIRVAPAIGILHTVYAVYHLSRGSKDRTPASTASYMIFAAVMDASVLPFLAFTAFMSQQQYIQPANAAGHWKTLFEGQLATSKILYSTYLISVTAGGMHMASLLVSIYLAVKFRQISKLPPDMNPLEDNLTSRRAHKRNKSSMSYTTEGTNSNRNSAQPLMNDARKVPFMHTREQSTAMFSGPPSPISPASHRDSRVDLQRPMYSGSPRGSQADIRAMRYPDSSPPSARSSRTDLRRDPRGPAVKHRSSALSNPSFVTAPSPSGYRPASSRPTSATVAQAKRSSMYHGAPAEDNWFAKGTGPGDADADAAEELQDHGGLQPPELQHLRTGSSEHTPKLVLSPSVVLPMPQKAGYESLDENARPGSARTKRSRKLDFSNRSPRPLGMHPPTPPTTHRTPPYTPVLTASADANPYKMARAALREVGHNAGAAGSPATFEETQFLREQMARGEGGHQAGVEAGLLDEGADVGGTGGGGKGRFYGNLRGIMGGRSRGGRAVSTGMDEALAPAKGLRGREVSGKVAEEGRA